jgi:competence protein ComEC
MIPRTVLREIAQQRMVLFHWSPVAMACGIGVFFSYGWLVALGLCGVVGLAAAAYLTVNGWRDHALLPSMVLVLSVALGGMAGMLRRYLVSAPVLSYPYNGDIMGCVVQVDRSNSNAPRYTLDQLTLGPIPADKTPRKIRVSVHDKTGASDARIGDIIKMRGYISPPQGPVEPDGFDFRKYAYFLELGAVGYARDAPIVIGQSEQKFWFKSMQTWLSDLVDQSIDPKVSGFAKALIAGDRRDMQTEVIEDLRATNLAHLLAISGLHMRLLTSLVYFCIRVICVMTRGMLGRHARTIAGVMAI